MVGSENQPQAGQVSKIATIKSNCLANRTSIDRVGIIQYLRMKEMTQSSKALDCVISKRAGLLTDIK